MGAITLDEYRKRLKENNKTTNKNNNTGAVTNQRVTAPNTISYDDYKSKYSPKLSTEATMTGNSILLPTMTKNNNLVQQQEEQYVDTGKTYGDYFYQDYATRRNDKIYSKGGKYYVFNSRTNQYDNIDSSSTNNITTVEEQKKQKEEAKKLGYRDYNDEQQQKIQNLENKYNSLDEKYNKTYSNHEKVQLAKKMFKLKQELEQAKKNNKYLTVSDRINLDTGDLSKKEYAEYSKDLQRQEEKLNKEQAEKTKVRYSGTGVDALKQIGSKASDVAYTADKEIIAPIKSAGDNYNIGKRNNELAIEYYKKMEGKENNAEELEKKINKYNRYNQDLITSPGAMGSAIQNMDTQVQSAWRSGLTAGIGGAIGGTIGGIGGAFAGGVGAVPGAIAGAKVGASIGYTIGGTPYTYKLEAGNQYKDLIEQGIPKNIAKDLSRKTGAINAAIESGENILDLITFGQAGKLTSAPQKAIYSELVKEYGEKSLKTLLVQAGTSYSQNILSETAEEMAQEGTSILAEKEAFKKAGLDRAVTDEEDLNRILEAGKSAAISTAFTAPITSAGGTIATNIINTLQTKAVSKVNTLTNTDINTEIKNEILNYAKENNTNLTTEEVLAIQQQVENNIEQSNITVIDNTNNQQNNIEQVNTNSNNTTTETQNLTQTQIKQKIKDLQLELKSYQQLESDGTFVGATDEVISSLKTEIKDLQNKLKNQTNIPTVEDIVNQEKNQQEIKLPTGETVLQQEKLEKNNNLEYNNTISNGRQDFTNSLTREEWYNFYKKVDNHGIETKQAGSKSTIFVNDKIILSEHDGIKPDIYDVYQAVETSNEIAQKYGLTKEDIIQDIFDIAGEENIDEGKIKNSLEKYFKEGLLRRYNSNNNAFVGENQYTRENTEQNNRNSGTGNGRRENISSIDQTNRELDNSSLFYEKSQNLPTQKDINKNNLPINEDMNLKSLESTAPEVEKNTLGYIPQDPTRESSYDNEITDSIKETLADPINEFKRSLDREMEENIKSPKKIKENNDIKRKAESMWGDFQEKFVNRNYEIDKLAKQTKNSEIMFKGDMLNSVAGETSGDINVAQTDNYGRRIGESLNGLFKNSKKKGYYEQFDDYLKHYSNIDRYGYGKGSSVPLEYSQKMVQAYEQSIPGIKNEATKVWQYGKNLLNNMEESGLISKEFKGTLEEMYPHYVPYMQSESMVPYMDDSGEIKPKKVIKRAEGGAHDLVTIEEAFERYTYATKKAIRQNDLYKEIVKTSKEKVSFGADDRVDPTQLDNSLMRDAEGNNYLTAYVDGIQQQAKISDNLYQELTKTNEQKVKNTESKYSLVLKPIQKISEVRRNILTTWNPSFILTNSMKDIQDGMFNSKYTKDMIKNYPGAFIELATQSTETAQQFTSLYGSGMVMGEYQIDRLTNSTKNMDINQLNSIIKALPNANEIVELAPRYAEFKASLQNGASVTEAMYNAREVTTNFNRGGYITKALNRNGFTFLNASVQGFDKMIRNLTGVNGTKGFVASTTGIMLKVTALGIAPAMFNAMSFNAGDDDEDKDYKALPDYIKDNYYLIKTKGLGNKTGKYYDGTFLRIPKGRMLSVFGSAARRTLEYSKGDKNAFDGFLENAQSQIGINNPEENNIIAPIKQAFGSKNGEAWYGGDLIPKRLQNKPVAEQYDEGTDEFSKWLGKMINVSPYKINYLLDQYSGGAGDIVLPMITKETTNGATTVGDYLIAPVKDKFIVNSTDDNKYASKFYTSLEKMQTKANSDNASTSDKLKYKYISSISSDMSKLYKEKREIQLDDSLSKKEKYKKVQAIQKEINKLAEEGIKEPKIKDVKSHYAKVENTEYYKNSKGSWTTIKDEESSELKSLRMSANEKSNYFKVKNKIGAIRTSDIESSEKKDKISNLIINMNMSDDKLAYIYGKYYSNEETLDMIQSAGISIKEFIKYNNQTFESDYYTNGKTVKNSKLAKTINYVNTLNLSAVQKAILIKMKYSSYKKYDKQIAQYINSQNLDYFDKLSILKKIGFTAYDKQIIKKVNSMNISKEEKIKKLKDLGFKVRNGRVYSK